MYSVLNVHQNLLKSGCVFSRMQKNEVFLVVINEMHVDLNLLHCVLSSSLVECFCTAVIFQTVIITCLQLNKLVTLHIFCLCL